MPPPEKTPSAMRPFGLPSGGVVVTRSRLRSGALAPAAGALAGGVGRDQLVDARGQLRPCVLLEEVAAADGSVGLPRGAGDVALQDAIDAARDRVSVAEQPPER